MHYLTESHHTSHKVEYANNTLICLATGLAPFQYTYGYQPPLFPAHTFNRHWCGTWSRALFALPGSVASYTTSANCCPTSVRECQLGQQVWLSTKDLPMQMESNKLAPKLVNSAAVQLKLIHTMRVHLMFHVSRIKPIHNNLLVHLHPPHH